jgi:mono/diheme cytochrome c family protein
MEGLAVRSFPKIAFLLLLAYCAFLSCPQMLAAQEAKSSSPDAKDTLYDQQRRGEFLFIKNCALCHLRDSERPANAPPMGKEAAGVFGIELRGIFKNPNVHEDDVKQRVLKGLPKMMPSFQYILDSKQIDDLIAFFKVPYPATGQR